MKHATFKIAILVKIFDLDRAPRRFLMTAWTYAVPLFNSKDNGTSSVRYTTTTTSGEPMKHGKKSRYHAALGWETERQDACLRAPAEMR